METLALILSVIAIIIGGILVALIDELKLAFDNHSAVVDATLAEFQAELEELKGRETITRADVDDFVAKFATMRDKLKQIDVDPTKPTPEPAPEA